MSTRSGFTPRVVYIAGVQNCGSTMLDAVLGHAPGAASLGEAGGFHRYRTEARCDCGKAPATCDPCQAVVAAWSASGGLEHALDVAAAPGGGRGLHWALLPTARRRAYAALADAQLTTAAGATGAEVVIDSSKNVGRLAALLLDGRLDVRVVHLVRDPRGHVGSRRRRRRHSRLRESAPVVVARWVAKNALFGTVLRRRAGPGRYLLCRYEDLVRAPEAELARIGAFAELDATGLAAAATGPGVTRSHLFEPARRVDYGRVRIDPARVDGQRLSPAQNRRFWYAGGFVAGLWGYDRDQRYLEGS